MEYDRFALDRLLYHYLVEVLVGEGEQEERHATEYAEGGLEGRNLAETSFSDFTDRENLNFRYIYIEKQARLGLTDVERSRAARFREARAKDDAGR